ncbi:hypothetical protein ECEC1846_2222 [Escherichia coli EC1846]|nr:hypothetical protein ECEC1846_2222 [Escherichia coli EC1846]
MLSRYCVIYNLNRGRPECYLAFLQSLNAIITAPGVGRQWVTLAAFLFSFTFIFCRR